VKGAGYPIVGFLAWLNCDELVEALRVRLDATPEQRKRLRRTQCTA